jgi:uncharacterized transporter YbjL
MSLELSTPLAAVAFLVLVGVVAGGTFMSPMAGSTLMMVIPGLVVFGVLSLLIGVFHGQYRAKRA